MAEKSENNPQNERKIKDNLSKGQKKITASGKVRKRGERSKNKTVTRKATGKRKSAVSSNTIRTDITDEEAMRILEENCGKAEEILEDPTQREDFLRLVEKKIASVPLVGGAFAYAPLMLSLLKSYISGGSSGTSPRARGW